MNTTPNPSITPPPSVLDRVCIGLDVSKDTLDACLLLDGPPAKRHEKQFSNDAAGHAQLLRWAHALAADAPCHFCLEATGPYSHSIALFLVEAEQRVSVVNPARIRFFALSQNAGNKTDKADARLIALYCQRQQPPLWRVADASVRALQALTRRLHALSELVVQEKNRLHGPGQDKAILASSRRIIAALEKEMGRLKLHIRAHLKAHENLSRDAKLLQSIPGIGEITAWDMLAELPDVQEFGSAQSAAADAGLSPRQHQSGSSVKKPTHLSKRGNARLRKALYFPAVTALTWNPLVRSHYQRLIAQGKPKMVALAACMRKLLMICYGVLKHQQPFNAAYQQPLEVPLKT